MTEFHYLTSDLEALEGLKNYYGWIFDEIRPDLGNRIAEVGGGLGTFTEFLVEKHLLNNGNCHLEVFEPAVNLYQRLHEKLITRHPKTIETGRLKVTNGYFQPAGSFDTIVLINVLEHIENHDETIAMMMQALSPGGAMIVFVPALSWLYSPLDKAVGHYRRYDRGILEALFARQKLEIVKAKYMDFMGILPWFLFNVVCKSHSINPRLALTYDQWFIPVTRWLEGLHPPGVGKNLLVVGRKTKM